MMKSKSNRFTALGLAVGAMFSILNAPVPTFAGTAPLQFNGYYNGGRLIYDPNTDLTWYQPPYSSAGYVWNDALTWAANLNIGGVTGWQLPSIAPLTPADIDAGTSYSDSGQLGYLWYDELGNQAGAMNNSGRSTPLCSIRFLTVKPALSGPARRLLCAFERLFRIFRFTRRGIWYVGRWIWGG